MVTLASALISSVDVLRKRDLIRHRLSLKPQRPILLTVPPNHPDDHWSAFSSLVSKASTATTGRSAAVPPRRRRTSLTRTALVLHTLPFGVEVDRPGVVRERPVVRGALAVLAGQRRPDLGLLGHVDGLEGDDTVVARTV